MEKKEIAIVGGGISGLSLAFWLIFNHGIPGSDIVLFEKSPRVGGLIHTYTSPTGQIYETGPRSIRASGKKKIALHQMLQAISLDKNIVFPSPLSYQRYCLLNGIPSQIPSKYSHFFTLPIGRKIMRYSLFEPISAYTRQSYQEHESLYSWIERFCPNDRDMKQIMSAYTSGIWASDADTVSCDLVLPYIRAIEKKSYSLMVGFIKEYTKSRKMQKEDAAHLPSLFSFHDGLSMLPKNLFSWLVSQGVKIQCNYEIADIAAYEDGWKLYEKKSDISICKRLIFSVDPLHISEKIERLLQKQIWYREEFKESISLPTEKSLRSSIASISFGWKEEYPLPYNGFGILASQEEDRLVLGMVFDSSLFKEHQRSMKTRISVMIGGVKFPEVCRYSDDELLQIGRDRIHKWTKIERMADEYSIFRFPQSIMVPTPDRPPFSDYLSSQDFPRSLFIVSSAIGGVAIADCISSSQKLAKRMSEC